MKAFSSARGHDVARVRQPGMLVAWISLLASLLSASTPALAAGSWIWLDSQGRKVYSDMPPPSNLPEQRILQRPASDPVPATMPQAAVPVSPETVPAAVDGRSADAGARRPAERPLYQRNEEALRENCRRARAALQTLNSGLRLQMLNDKGEQVELDDAMRSQEIRRMQQEEHDNCVPERRIGKR